MTDAAMSDIHMQACEVAQVARGGPAGRFTDSPYPN